MGAVPSVPVSDIQRIAKETIETFTPLYLKAFADAMLADMRAAAQDNNARLEALPQLLEPEPPSEPIGEGWGTKMGGVVKNWKRRYFVARNMADNYVIDYYATEEDAKNDQKRRGRIVPNHMRVKELKSEEDRKEVKAPGEHCLRLGPYWSSDRRRTWYICFEDEEQMRNWESTLEFAAFYASAPLNEDPIRRIAFITAYRQLRWELGVWGYYSYNATEQEMLGLLISTKCEREVMEEVYAKIGGGPAATVIRRNVRGILDSTVGTAVAAGWKAIEASIGTVQPKIRDVLDKSIGSIIELQAQIEARVADEIINAVSPVLTRISEPILKPVLDLLFKPLLEAHEECVKGFHGACTAMLQESAAFEGQANRLQRIERECRYSYAGWLRDAIQKLRVLRRYSSGGVGKDGDLLIVVQEIFGDSMTFYQVERMFEAGIRANARAAVWTYTTLCNGGSAAETPEAQATNTAVMPPADALRETMTRLVMDSKTMAKRAMTDVLYDLIIGTFRREVTPTIKAALGPIKALVVSPLDIVVNVDAMVDNAIHTMVRGVIMEAVVPAADPTLNSKLDSFADPTILPLVTARAAEGYPAARGPVATEPAAVGGAAAAGAGVAVAVAVAAAPAAPADMEGAAAVSADFAATTQAAGEAAGAAAEAAMEGAHAQVEEAVEGLADAADDAQPAAAEA